MTNKEKTFIESVKHGGTHSFFKRAAELGVKVTPLADQPKVVRLSYKGKVIYVRTGSIPAYRMMGQFTKNKTITKSVLNDVKICVPQGIVLEDLKSFKKSLIKKNNLKFPLIVKPQNSSRAKGVTWNVQNLAEAEAAVKYSAKLSKGPIMIEEMFVGEEFRALVYKDRVISAVHKIPPTIYGDGQSTIAELIEKYNLNRKKEHLLIADAELKKELKKMGLTLGSVPPKDKKLKVKNTFLMSQGARLVSANKYFDKYYVDVCKKAVAVLNLQLGGVDIIVNLESKKPSYVILEVNPNPFYNMHESQLVEGMAYDVSQIILFDLFPVLKKKN